MVSEATVPSALGDADLDIFGFSAPYVAPVSAPPATSTDLTNEILASLGVAGNSVNGAPSISAEAREILASLPDMSFMLSAVRV